MTLQDLWAAGVSTRDIAERLCIAVATVKQRAKRAGLPSRQRTYRVSDEVRQTRDDLAEMMAEGCPSIAEAARRLKLTQVRADQHWQAIRAALGEQAI